MAKNVHIFNNKRTCDKYMRETYLHKESSSWEGLVLPTTQQTNTYLKLTIETLEKGEKYTPGD